MKQRTFKHYINVCAMQHAITTRNYDTRNKLSL